MYLIDFLTKKVLFNLDAEMAHNIVSRTLGALSYSPQLLNPLIQKNFIDHPELTQELFGKSFYNPVGLAAGFDKNASMNRSLLAFGFGHLEFGSVTRVPQEGNEKPRLFRYTKEKSLQNAMGFNNDGGYKVAHRLQKLYPFAVPIGINLGKNKDVSNEDAIADYVFLVKTFNEIVDYIVINFSSPNTKNLRDLQNKEFIEQLFEELQGIVTKPILFKIAPDMSSEDAIDLCSFAIEKGAGGIIATNTTSDYSLLTGSKKIGGISGEALQEKSFAMFKDISKELFGKTTLISVGGISNAKEAYRRILHGANLVQIYTAFIYEGSGCVRNINTELLELLKSDGYTHISQAVGANIA